MMSSGGSVTRWVTALRDGDDEAARQLWDRYFQKLVRLARQKLADTPRCVADEEDVALSVFRRLCDGALQGGFANLGSRDELWRLLVTITTNRVIDQQRRLTCEKRMPRAKGEPEFGRTGPPPERLDEIVAEEPTPEFLCQLAEEHARLLELLDDDALRQVVLLKLEGMNNEEVAGSLGITSRSVRRKLARIREIWCDEVDP